MPRLLGSALVIADYMDQTVHSFSTSDRLGYENPVIHMTDVNTSTVAKRNIKTIKTSGAKLDTLIHTTAVILMQRAHDHGDTSLVASLLDAMPKGGRPKALKAWFETFSPIRVNGDGKVGLLAADKRVWLIAEATAKPYWDLNPEKDVQVFDLDKALSAILNRAAKQQKDGIFTPDEATTKRLAAVAKLVKAS